MRPAFVAILLFAALFTGPTAAAAEPVLTDAAGDAVAFTWVAGAIGPPAIPVASTDTYKPADLLALAVDETEDDLIFHLTVDKQTVAEPWGGVNYNVFWTWNDEDYAISMGWFRFAVVSDAPFTWGSLYRIESEDEWDLVAEFEPHHEPGAAHLVVPKVYILDSFLRQPGRGDTLHDLRVDAWYFQAIGQFSGGFASSGFVIHDRMPDDGSLALPITKGDYSQGSIVLGAPDRIRVSNGGATTFVFDVVVNNLAAVEHEVRFEVTGLPDDWQTKFAPSVKVPANAKVSVPLLASVPFGHVHGGFTAFNLTATSTTDPQSQGRVRLGVLHTPIPQPAGHHPELYLHAEAFTVGNPVLERVFQFSDGWMNTDANHDGEAEFMTANFDNDWYIPLFPDLAMGLDFDLESLGKLTATLVPNRVGEATVTAKLWLVQGTYDWAGDFENADNTLLAESDPLKVALDLQNEVPLDFTLTPTAEADYIPYAPNNHLVLVLDLERSGPQFDDLVFVGGMVPKLKVADFKMTLPLLEYHDRLIGNAEVQSALSLIAEGVVEKSGRPGTILTYAFTLRNEGEARELFDIDVAGNDAALGKVVPREGIALDPGVTKRVTLAVAIPVDAAEGSEFEVLLFAHARTDPTKTAVARTVTRVATSGNVTADEADILLAAQEAERATPGAPVIAALVALGAVAAMRRR